MDQRRAKKGYVDSKGFGSRTVLTPGNPDHWDVQENGGRKYFRVDLYGNKLP
jgi:hypothetical protein